DNITKHLNTLKAWDKDSYEHSLRVGLLSINMGYELKLNHDNLVYVGQGGLLHDIGKKNIPWKILTKDSKLTTEEKDVMDKHSLFSYEELEGDKYNIIREITLYHHGYKEELALQTGAKSINPLLYEIVSCADIYDALKNPRCYRKEALSKEKVRNTMNQEFKGYKSYISMMIK
ncbi:MAG: HD domain-containing protein, partial [Nanoarchaeota archaeon]|nr:HD domain-containing protein [Nanoarchaeota archaeon]